MNAGKIILLIFVILVVFLIGGGLGIMYQSQKSVQSPQPSTTMPPIVKQLSSKVVTSIIFNGQVTNINGKNITLSYQGDSTTIKVNDSAPVYSFTIDSKGISKQQKVDFSQIKNGDNVNINSKLLSDNTLEGESVIILPATTTK